MILRILRNSYQHIKRSGWVGWASSIVMTFAFLVVSIFGGFAYVANLYIQFIEQKSNMIVFFEVGVDKEIVDSLKNKWETDPLIKEIEYIGEETAYELYSGYAQKAQPEIYSALNTQDQKKLPSSLEVKIFSLDSLDEVEKFIRADVAAELESLKIYDAEAPETEEQGDEESVLGATASTAEQQTFRYKFSEDPNEPPIKVRVDVETLEELKDIMDKVRIAGIGILTLLLVVVCIFIFMISEFRLYNQKEEIGVMQLVGGSLSFIRAPYILEGGFYGAMGAFLSTGTIYALLYWIFVLNQNANEVVFIYRYFASLDWPNITTLGLAGLAGTFIGIGFLLGATSSYLSIRRYIR